MRKLAIIIAAAAALIPLCSCEQILDSITTEPTFQILDLYDGQDFRIVRTSTCNYLWSGFDTRYVNMELNGKEAWIRVKLPAGATSAIETSMTANNADKPEIAAVTHQFKICPWRISILEYKGTDDKGKDQWEYLKDNDLAGVGGKKISVSMEAIKEVGGTNWVSISSIPMTIKEYASLKWTISEEDKALLSDFEEHETYVTFTVPGIIEKIEIKAALNDVEHSVTLIDSTF